MPVEPVPLRPDQTDAAGAVLGRAFMEDPLFVWVAPDERRRARFLTGCMTVFVRYVLRHGDAYGAGEPLTSVALWLPPGETDVGRVAMLRAGILGPMLRLGLSGSGKFARAGQVFEGAHERAVAGAEHWYLMDLGVEPAQQGRGVGGALIAPMLLRIDGEGLPVYLETANERNIEFYRRHGFEVVAEQRVPPDGPLTWSLLRRPA